MYRSTLRNVIVFYLGIHCASSFILFQVSRVDTCGDCDEASGCYDLGFLGVFCSCGYGYQGNGTICEDDDECSLGTHTCPAGESVCVNMPGSFTCLSCPFGVSEDNSSCLKTFSADEAGIDTGSMDGGSGEDDESIQASANSSETLPSPNHASQGSNSTHVSPDTPTPSSSGGMEPSVSMNETDAENDTRLSGVVVEIRPRKLMRTPGSNGSICCIAHDFMENLTISWYHNGNLLNSTNETYFLENITESDSGFYQCQLSLEDDFILSSISEIVVEDENLESVCEVATKKTFIPQECPSRVGDNGLELRFCPKRPCQAGDEDSECDRDEQEFEPLCCSPSGYEKLQIPCYGFVLGLITPSQCNCEPCDRMKARTDITLNGRVLDSSGRIPLRFGKVFLGGVEVAETDILGSFSIPLPRGIERLVLTFTDPRFSTFHEATKVLHLRTDKSSISHTFHIPMLQKETVKIQGNTVMITHKAQDIAKIGFPADKNLDDLDIYGNVVSQSIYGITYKIIIGDSFTVDDNRLEQPISIVFLVCLTVKDKTETSIDIPGKYTFGFDKMYVTDFTKSHGIDQVFLFELDSASGYWNKLTMVKLNDSDENNLEAEETFLAVDVDLSGEARWYALGGVGSPCLLKVGTPSTRGSENSYADLSVFRTPIQLTSTWSSVTSSLITGQSSNCLLTSCGIHNVIIRDRAGKESRLVLDIQRSAFKENEDPLVNTTAVEGRYRALRSCTQQGSFDIITSSREDDVMDKHTLSYLEETSLALLQELPPEDLYMAWYPMAYGNIYKACYIKIRSVCGDTETVTVRSYPGTYMETRNQLYGIRSSVPSRGSACVEYKCSGPLYTQVDTDITAMEITIGGARSRCYASDISDFLLRRMLLETPGVDQPVNAGFLRMHAPVGTEGSLYGLYSATSQTSAEEARDNAWRQCMNGADSNQVDRLGGAGGVGGEARGVAVTFGPTRLNLIEASDNSENNE